MTTCTDRQKACIDPCRPILRALLEFIDKEGPAARQWEAISELCEKGWLALDHALESTSPIPGFSEPDGGADVRKRQESTAEHIARDIREGRFPGRSEPQMVDAEPSQPAAPALDSAAAHIAEVFADGDGTKHIQAVIEDLDDIPAGSKLYLSAPSLPSAPSTAAQVASATRQCMRKAWQADSDRRSAAIVAPTPVADSGASDGVLHALRAAKQFIANGAEFGYIRMPDSDCPDPAHEVPKLIDSAIELLAAAKPVSVGAGGMDSGELEEFAQTVEDFDGSGETSTPYDILMDWAERGFLDCDHFSVTDRGRALLGGDVAHFETPKNLADETPPTESTGEPG